VRRAELSSAGAWGWWVAAWHGEQLDTWITAVDAANLITKVTDAVNEELAAWRNWPLDRICPV
jgi:hypothetical protein